MSVHSQNLKVYCGDKMIGIVCAAQMELSPFIKKYTKVFDEMNVPYEIIHWDRSGEKTERADNVHTFTEPLFRYASKIKKLLPFLRFSKYASKIIKEKKYDKLVVLTTQTAVLIPNVLLFNYKKKYFFDYRDTSYENISLYRKFVTKIADNSIGMCFSSPGFKEYVKTKTPTVIAHNFQDKHLQGRTLECKKSTDGKIRMGYIGVLREYEYLASLVEKFGKDERFEFLIHGGGDDLDKLKALSENYTNIKVFGAYKEDEKTDILKSFDMICYNYPKSFVNYPALANKFYDGMIAKKPMFANSLTFSGMMVSDNGLGISIDENDENITDKIYTYYQNLDEKAFSENCEKFLAKVGEDEKAYIEAIKNIAE